MQKNKDPKATETLFILGDDGRLYISGALIYQSAITKAQIKT
ncbi:hypothetical protein [Pseudomonas taiwanensis]|nr:hypothetical protein [Pseudomonas taiwanensis]